MKNLNHSLKTKIGIHLDSNLFVKIAEIFLVFFSAFLIIKIISPYAGENLVMKQAVIWLANIVMLIIIFLGMRLRGESCSDFGLTFGQITWKKGFRIFLLSLLVFVLAVTGFIIGSIIMANITGIPENADMSSYEYMKDNVFMFILTLCGVYIVSSFGEEVVYRAFLINRLSEFGINSKYWKSLAVIISAVIFGFAHYQWGPMGIVQTGFMGLALGICYIKLKKNLWILILAHSYMDTILMTQMYMANS